MNRLTRLSFVFILLAAVTACAGPKVSQDYNEDTEFDPGWGRYEWRGGTSQIDGVSHSRLQRITEQAMVQRGYRLDPDNPQFYVSVSGTTRAAVGGGKSVGISIGLPVGNSGSIGLGGSKSLEDRKQEGVIIVDITDAENNELVWRGSAEGIALRDFELAREQQLRKVIDRLLAQFPPE
ncbi:DUF4136 domain-containing protein [Marinimicrobium sp. LS-A18]|uniref:DUF4136 domain-containing protein n=1 Tax=Marinimicrobium sp. LS-A18 TaxID=1381596 RepID=UPI000466D52F|nr:DUF4136 domain-containing protein [Marinimicrobium sp. LS-A18]